MSGQGQPRALANATLPDGRRGHVVLAGDRVAAVGAGEAPAGAARVDLDGRLVLPALIDGHLHLDKTVLGLPWMPHAAEPSLASRIATEKRLRRRAADARRRAREPPPRAGPGPRDHRAAHRTSTWTT